MKRMIAGILLALSLLFALAGCGKKMDGNPLRVGMECGYAPYNWTQSDDGNGAVPIADSQDYAYGYDVMMAKLLAEELGREVVVYKIDWDSLPLAVQSGKVDCVIAGQSITSERQETVDFTLPYYYATVVTLVKEDSAYADAASIEDFAGATVTSQLNTIWYDVLSQIPDADIQPAQETVPGLYVALDSGKVDAVVVDLPTALAAVEAYPDFKLLSFGETGGYDISDEDINIGISVQKGNTELVDALNASLETMTAEDFDRMMQEAIALQPLSNIE